MPLIINDQADYSYVTIPGDLDTYNKIDARFAAEARLRFTGNNPEQGGIFIQRRALHDSNPTAFDWVLGYEGFGHLYFLRQFAGNLRIWRVLAEAMIWEEPGLRVGDTNIRHHVNLLDGSWHQIGVSVDLEEVKLYVDGREMKIELVSNVPAAYVSQPDYSLIIGFTSPEGSLPEQTFDGEIEEVRLWRQGPEREKMRQWANRRLQGNEEGLLGYWPMNDTDARDLCGGNHGTIVNASIRPSSYLPDVNSPDVFHETVLVEDYKLGQEDDKALEKITSYRTVVSFYKPDGSAWHGEIALSAPEHCRIEVDGDVIELSPAAPVVVRVNITGQMEWMSEVKDETAPPPIIITASSFMHAQERLIVYRDDVLHHKMAALNGASLRTDQPGRPALLDPTHYTLECANDFARSIRDVMGRYASPRIQAHAQTTNPNFVAFHHTDMGLPLGVAYAVRHQLSGQSDSLGKAVTAPERQLRYAAPLGMLAAANHDLVRESHFMLLATPHGVQRIELDEHGYATESANMVSNMRIEAQSLSSLWDRFVNGATKATKVLVKVTERLVHDVVTKATQYIRTIKATIETAIDKAKEFIIDTIERAAKLVQGLFNWIEKQYHRFVEWVSDKTGWSDVLLTRDVIKLQINDVLDGSVAMLGTLKQRAARYFGELQNQLDEQFDMMRNQLIKTGNSSEFVGANRRQVLDAKGGWLLRKLYKHGPKATVPEFHSPNTFSDQGELDRLIQRFINVVEDPKIGDALLDAVEGIRTALKRPQQAPLALMVAGLDSLKALSRLVLGLTDVLLDIALTLFQQVIIAMREALNEEIKIPFISKLYRDISGGQTLTMLDLATLIVALPVTVVYRRHNNDQAPFNNDELSQLRQHKPVPLGALSSPQSSARWDEIKFTVAIEKDLVDKVLVITGLTCAITLCINAVIETVADIIALAPNLPDAKKSLGSDSMSQLPIEASEGCLQQGLNFLLKIGLQIPSLIASVTCFSIRGTDSKDEGQKTTLTLYGADIAYWSIGILREAADFVVSFFDKFFPAKMATTVKVKGLSNVGDVVTVLTSMLGALHCLSAVAVTVCDIVRANDKNVKNPDSPLKIGLIATSNLCSTLPGTCKFLGLRPLINASEGVTFLALVAVDLFANMGSGTTTLCLALGIGSTATTEAEV
ncbi:hypothetical protein UNDYM_5944 (plasmid) [Undibacterium sp. YM2]|uniref:LamG domain-containing protein n=1 Tax=Undibacterium sp. YM2 TaxID=2058625 RepID=UPI001331FBF7|nr:LamG domain-containing protein [Undibacterium sp. YM2]BBB70197.1 hypothetical protein UNDYM_5944 [Undibacterium sp. YM2]